MVARDGPRVRRGTVPRFVTQFAFDALAWTVALGVGTVLRFELNLDRVTWIPLDLLCIAAVVLQFVFGWVFYCYRGRHPVGSFGVPRSDVFIASEFVKVNEASVSLGG